MLDRVIGVDYGNGTRIAYTYDAAGNRLTYSSVVAKHEATVTLGHLSHTYDGTGKNATATTVPEGLTVNFTYDGSPNAPVNAGGYTVIGTVNDPNYQGSSTNTLVIGKATPTVATWPTATAITYGQTLASSTLSTGSASVAGSFAFTTPGTAPAAVTAAQSVTFTPLDAANYNPVSGSTSVTVNKATPAVTAWPAATAIIYGQTLAASTLNGGTASVAGSFAFTMPGTAPAAGTVSQSVTFTPTDTANYNLVSGTVSVTVDKATPTVTTWPTATAINYGQTLVASTLSGGVASVTGSFAFTTPDTAPGAGTASQSVTFTPTDTANYNPVSGTVSVTVNKATPTVTTWPTASAITYGQTLAASILSGGAGSVAGSFAFSTPGTAPAAVTASQDVTFTPSDTANYNPVNGTVSVTVDKATPTVTTWPTATALTYGQTLASSTLSGGAASVAGSFAFTTPGTAPAAGTAPQGVTFTPTDTANYNPASGSASVTVNKATPAVTTWPTATAIIYGQTLASSTLSGGAASVAGTFAFTTPGTAPGAGTASQSVTFTPTDTANYNPASGSASVTVNKATPTVTTWPTTTAITYGQTLAASTLSAGSVSVSGSFAFTTPGIAPAAGTASQSVTFTPTDTANYNPVSGTVSVTVDKAIPAVTVWPAASAITYGQTLAASILSGGAGSVAGSFAFSTPGTAPAAGTASQTVTFTPTDAANYNAVSGTVGVTVNKATPTVTAWPAASAITYGQTLAASTLSGGAASVAGSFAFTTPGTAPAAGTTAQEVTFTPTDTANYNPVNGTASVTVDKATPTVATWPSATAIIYGQTLASSTLSGGAASVTGSFAFTTLGTAPAAGIAAQGVTFTPADTANYNPVSGTVSVTVEKATPTVTTWPTASAITYGQTLAASTLSGGAASVAGNFAFTTPGTAPAVGTASQSVAFTPLDAANYNPVSGSASVTVNKATATVTLGSLSQTYDGTAKTVTATTAPASLTVDFTYGGSGTAPTNAGSYAVVGTVNNANYDGSATGTLVVGKATPTVTTWPSATAITYGQTLASSTLSGGAASVAGSFAFTTPGTAPAAGTATQGVTFTPTDTANYNPVSGTVSVTVDKATSTVTTWPAATAITYGQTLASSTLSGGAASVTGSFAFTTPGTAPAAGTTAQEVTFTPTDTANYNPVSGTVGVTVNKATPTVATWPTATAITYGQTLAASTLSGGAASVAGSFTFTTPGTAPAAGTASQGVMFTPVDTANFNPVTGTVSVTVNHSMLTISGLAANRKVYDGTTAATITGTPGLSGVIGSDSVSLTGTATGVFASKAVGNNKPITVSGLSLGGADAGNHTLSMPALTANITPAPLTVTGVTAANKVYDGTTSATINTAGATLNGVLATDTGNVTLVTSGATGTFADKNVGAGKLVAITGLTLSGSAAGNYALAQPTTTADIIAILEFTLVEPTLIGQTFRVAVASVRGPNYTLQYKNSLKDAEWTAAQTLSGTGGTITLTDGMATNTARFYRIRVE